MLGYLTLNGFYTHDDLWYAALAGKESDIVPLSDWFAMVWSKGREEGWGLEVEGDGGCYMAYDLPGSMS